MADPVYTVYRIKQNKARVSFANVATLLAKNFLTSVIGAMRKLKAKPAVMAEQEKQMNDQSSWLSKVIILHRVNMFQVWSIANKRYFGKKPKLILKDLES